MSDLDLSLLRPDKAPGMDIALQLDAASAAPANNGGATSESASVQRADKAAGMDAGFEADPVSSTTLPTDGLLEYALIFVGPREARVGDNGPWAFEVSNDQGASVAAPTAASLAATLPDGSPSGAINVALDSANLAATHRAGGRYALPQAGKTVFLIALTMADGTIASATATVFAQ